MNFISFRRRKTISNGNRKHLKYRYILYALILTSALILNIWKLRKTDFARPHIDLPSPFLGKVSEIYEPDFLYSPSKLCKNQGANLKLMIIVTSAPQNFKLREAIRETWGNFNNNRDFNLAFIVGISDSCTNSKIKEENKQHDDIIIGNFIDSYYNLTLKTITLLDWFSTKCLRAKYIVKADDDTFLNIERLLELTENLDHNSMTVYGRLLEGFSTDRDKTSKSYVSYEEFADNDLPQFLTGPAYMMSNKCANVLFYASLNEKYLKLEDVFLTGVVARRMGFRLTGLKEFVNLPNKNLCMLRRKISFHEVTPDDHRVFWHSLKDESLKCSYFWWIRVILKILKQKVTLVEKLNAQ